MSLIFNTDRVFGHALNTVNKIRPGSHKPPAADRLALYGLYKQSMEGDVATISTRPTAASNPEQGPDGLKKEQEKWDAWRANAGLNRTEAKRRYIETLIATMHEYASGTDEARELVEELEFVWDQIKGNSQHESNSERSSPLQSLERSGYLQSASSGADGGGGGGGGGVSSSTAAMDPSGGRDTKPDRDTRLRILSPVSQADDEDEAEATEEEEADLFVDAPISQVDIQDFASSPAAARDGGKPPATATSPPTSPHHLKRINSTLARLSTEIAALREQLESRRFLSRQRKGSLFGWLLRIGWWGVQIVAADVVVLAVVIVVMRRREDRRLEGAVRVLLGDAVATVQRVGREVKMPALPAMTRGRKGKGGAVGS
ncbi:hypothetical protein LTR08_004184 [Meristemomyces frigidus]|nr:hypothetical protein LTR08_004184 [Meristemomyces frigidus]